MKKIIRLTESDLARIVKRVIKEQTESPMEKFMNNCINKKYWANFILNTGSSGQKYARWGEKTKYKNWELTIYFNEGTSSILMIFITDEPDIASGVKKKFDNAVSNKTTRNGNVVTTSRTYDSTNEQAVADSFNVLMKEVIRLCINI
jgi:hypothetical protein